MTPDNATDAVLVAYLGVDPGLIGSVVERDLPMLKGALERMAAAVGDLRSE